MTANKRADKSKKRFTLIFHVNIGHGGYSIEIKRVKCNEAQLEVYADTKPLLLVISGWPKIRSPNLELFIE